MLGRSCNEWSGYIAYFGLSRFHMCGLWKSIAIKLDFWFLGGHELPDQRDPTQYPKNEILSSKKKLNFTTKRRKRLPHCLLKSRLLEKHSPCLIYPNPSTDSATSMLPVGKTATLCVLQKWGLPGWIPPFKIRGQKQKEKGDRNHCPLLPTACVLVVPCILSGYFFLQSHTACKGNWIQEYPTTNDKSPLHIPLLVAAAWLIYKVDN